MDHSIGTMQLHRDGFYFVVVKSYHTQKEFTVHNRWGSWMAGNPDAKRGSEVMRDVGPALAAALQARKVEAQKNITKMADNPFVAAATGANPFMSLAGK
jgi:hypothetical protein